MTSRYSHLDAAAFLLREQGASYAAIVRALEMRATGPHPTTGLWDASPASAAECVAREAARRGVPVPGPRRPRVRIDRPRIPRPDLSTDGRRFGVEIEVANLSTTAAARALNAAGIPARTERYNHETPSSHWKVTTDSTVRGCEVVTPPMSGEAGYDLLRRAMAALRAAGGRVDRSCGLHVHHDANDLTGDELAEVVLMHDRLADGIDTLVAPGRRPGGNDSSWCRRMTPTEVSRLAASLRRMGDSASPAVARNGGLGGRPDSRYRSLNVHSYGLYGTLEFRQHQGTLNGAKAVAWVKLGQAILAAAVRRTDAAAASLLDDLTGGGVLDSATADYLQRRAATLA